MSMLTGRYPDSLGIYDVTTPLRAVQPNAVTMPEYFKQRGYVTVGVGKVFHQRGASSLGSLNDPQSWTMPHWTPAASGPTANWSPALAARIESARDQHQRRGSKEPLPNGPVTEAPTVDDFALPDGLIARRAINLLEGFGRDRARPFFLAVGFTKPHLPFVAPKRFWDLYDPARVPLPTNTFPPSGAAPWHTQRFLQLQRYPQHSAQSTCHC